MTDTSRPAVEALAAAVADLAYEPGDVPSRASDMLLALLDRAEIAEWNAEDLSHLAGQALARVEKEKREREVATQTCSDLQGELDRIKNKLAEANTEIARLRQAHWMKIALVWLMNDIRQGIDPLEGGYSAGWIAALAALKPIPDKEERREQRDAGSPKDEK